MKAVGFRGGVHPPKNKEATKEKGVEVLPAPREAIIPLSQHLGAPSEPVVEKGTQVKIGQIIGQPKGFVSAPVHASISGMVKAIEVCPHPVLGQGLAVVIESDGKDEWSELGGRRDWEYLSRDEIKKLILEGGLVGLGGATFPTHVKLSPPEEKSIDTVILNGAECEPYLTADYRTMLERPGEVITGLKIIMRVLQAEKGYIGVEDDKPKGILLLKEKARGIPNVVIVSLAAKYPQGAEKQLIKVILNREVPSGGLPLDVGVVVHNVGTAVAITQAVTEGRPIVDRVVTVTGGVKDPKNLLVRIGTPFRETIEFCGGFDGIPGKVIMGGPMMGLAQYTLDVPVIKGTSGILVLRKDQVEVSEIAPCIRCGKCLDVCSMRLMPSFIVQYAEKGRFREAEGMDALDCIECGCCSYVCPAQRPLIHFIKFAKAEIMVAKKKPG